MGAATFISRILGLVREQVFAILFGAGNATDAYNVAFRIPNLLRDLFAEGSMSASLVPTFTRARVEEGDLRAWRLAGLVFRVLVILVGVLAALGMFFAPQLVGLYASAFKQVPGKFELTVQMTRIMFPFFPFVALAAAFMGILNACGFFFLPALASAIFNVVSVIVGAAITLTLFRVGPAHGIEPIQGMAIGVVVGGATQALFQLPSVYRAGYRWAPKRTTDPVWYRDPGLKRMLWMMIPGTVGLAATQVNILVNTVLATSQGTGSVTWLSYAFRLMQFPIGIFGVSLASATLPVISRKWIEKDLSEVTKTLTQTLKHVFAINLPASAGLAFLGFPIIQMIFQYGRFHVADTEATALALAMYAVGLTAYSAVKVLVPACYAFGNTRLAVISSILTVGVTIILNLLMVHPFGFWGLALGTSIGAIFNGVFLLFALRALLREGGGDLPLKPIFTSFLKNLVAALLMGTICLFAHRGLTLILPDIGSSGALGKAAVLGSRLLKVFVTMGVGLGSLIVIAKLLRLTDTVGVIDIFSKKLKKKLSQKKT